MSSGAPPISDVQFGYDELAERALDVAWERTQARLENGLRRIEQLTAALFDRSLERFEVESAIELCETTAVRIDALGFGRAADLLRDAAAQFNHSDLDAGNAVVLAAALDDARTIIATTVGEVKLVPRVGASLAVVGPICEQVDELVWTSSAQGLSVIHHIDCLNVHAPEPDAVIVVVNDPDLEQARPMLRSTRETYPVQPIILLAPKCGLEDRAAVAEWVTMILPNSHQPSEVTLELRREIARFSHRQSVGVIGDHADEVQSVLLARGMEATALQSPTALIEQLQTDQVRAVVLTPTSGDMSNESLIEVIRSDRATRRAVVVLVGDESTTSVDALRAGADSFFQSGLQPDELTAALKALLRRRAQLEPVRNVIGERSLQSWSMATIMIERLLLSAFRENLPVGLGLVTLPLGVDNDGNVDMLADEIAREFRSEDVIARHSPDLLVIVLRGATRHVLTRRLEQVHAKFDLADIGVRSVAVSFPADGRSLDELMEIGTTAMQRASAEGAPMIVRADWRDSDVEAPDVMLIDPDRNLGEVMVGTLVRRGLKVVHYRQALDAMDDLTRPGGPPLPKVVLMELDQRGLDGLQMLRQLREVGGLGRYRVVVLSTRSREMELQRAFELGAYDYVTKPFSAPLLVHRLGRALEA